MVDVGHTALADAGAAVAVVCRLAHLLGEVLVRPQHQVVDAAATQSALQEGLIEVFPPPVGDEGAAGLRLARAQEPGTRHRQLRRILELDDRDVVHLRHEL